jgi:hypothetical protein
MFQVIQIESWAEQRRRSDHQEEVIKHIIPDSIFDKHTKIRVITSAVLTESPGQPARILGPQRLRQQEQR